VIEQALAQFPVTLGFSLQSLDQSVARSSHGDRIFPAASVIKVPILLEIYRLAGEGALSLDEPVTLETRHKVGGAGVLAELHDGIQLTLEDLCRLMIVVSDNTASNLLLERAGFDSVNRLMSRIGMKHSHIGRWFMEPSGPERDNRTTADDATRCLIVLARGELLGSLTQPALDILRRQQYREKIPLRLPEQIQVASKSGELDGIRHDSALVELPGKPYVLSLFTDFRDRPEMAPWDVDRALAGLSHDVYHWLKES
jgi:beta-lactamase class A